MLSGEPDDHLNYAGDSDNIQLSQECIDDVAIAKCVEVVSSMLQGVDGLQHPVRGLP